MPKNITRWYLTTFLLINALALAVTGSATLAANAEFQSTARTALVAGIFILAVLTLFAGFWLLKHPQTGQGMLEKMANSRQQTFARLLLGFVFTVSWGLFWLPAEKSGDYYYYFIGIQPILGWAAFASGLGLALTLTLDRDFSVNNGLSYWRDQKIMLRAAGISLLLMGFIAASIAFLKIWAAGEPFWYGAGVPLLVWQVYILVMAAFLLRNIRIQTPAYLDAILFFLIWGISAALWSAQPLQASFFFTPPMFPNHEFYPFADLETFDRASQYALIGQGINNGRFFDRTLYIAFAVYLHTFFGQNYEILMAIQAGVFAVFPAVIYLIGKELHSRRAGILVAALASWRGVNALAAMALIDTSTVKHMLTDFPTGLGLAIACLFIIQWLKDPLTNWHKAAWATGALGLTSLLRPHVMVILIIILVIIFIQYLPRWRKSLAIASLGVAAFLASVSPWMFFGGGNISIIELYATRIRSVIEQRYLPPPEEHIPFLPGKPGLLVVQIQEKQPFDIPFPVNQFLNNLQTSALTVPLSLQFRSIRETVKETETIWQSGWPGELSLQAGFMFALGLGLVALGLGAALQKSRWAGLVLPAAFLIYAGANGLARTSGGRYIVPIDWIVIFFFGVGLVVLLEALDAFFKKPAIPTDTATTPIQLTKTQPWGVRVFAVLAGIGLIGGLIPFSQTLHPQRYQPRSANELLGEIEPFLSASTLDRKSVEQFLESENADLLHGAALYPRFLHQDHGFPSWPPYSTAGYPRTIFVLIGPQPIFYTTILYGPIREYLPHNHDILVLGCHRTEDMKDFFDALLVVVDKEVVYTVQPERPLACPVQEPVCNNNKKCQ